MIESYNIFFDIGMLVLLCVVSYGIYQVVRMIKGFTDNSVRMNLVERIAIDNWAKAKGIDLSKEIAETKVMDKLFDKKDFQTKVKNEVYDAYFKEKKKK